MIENTKDIGELAAALAKAQSEIVGAVKDSKNPYFETDYADLASVIGAIRQPLNKHGITFLQLLSNNDEGWPAVTTVLAHASGQSIKSTLAIKPSKMDAQGMGSAITYARRYSLASIVGVPQIDDDGEGAVDRKPVKKKDRGARKRPTVPSAEDKKAMYERLRAKAEKEFGEITEKSELKNGDFCSGPYVGQKLCECIDWQDNAVTKAKEKGLENLSSMDQRFAFLASSLKKARSEKEKKYREQQSARQGELKELLRK